MVAEIFEYEKMCTVVEVDKASEQPAKIEKEKKAQFITNITCYLRYENIYSFNNTTHYEFYNKFVCTILFDTDQQNQSCHIFLL